jgi:hypothetical protein
MSLDSVVAVARRVEIDHVTNHYQGRIVRRTVANTPVLEVVELVTAPTLPGPKDAQTTGGLSVRQPNGAGIVGGDFHGH